MNLNVKTKQYKNSKREAGEITQQLRELTILPKDQDSNQHPHGSSQLSVIPVPGD